jgi:hypothetical protein
MTVAELESEIPDYGSEVMLGRGAASYRMVMKQ